MAVLGAVMLDPEILPEVAEILPAESFYQVANRRIWEGVVELQKKNVCPDLVNLRAVLERRGHLEEAGGTAYLRELLEACGSTANAMQYARLVRSAWVSRRIRETCVNLATAADTGAETGEELAERGVQELSRLIDTNTQEEGVEIGLAVDRALMENRTAGYITSLENLHRLVPRFRAGELVVIAGRPGHGKTTLMRTITRDLADFSGVVVFSLEESPEEFAGALVASEAGISKGQLLDQAVKPEQQDALQNARRIIHDLPVVIERARSVEQIVARSRRWARRRPLNAIVVDYLQLLTSSRRTGFSKRHLELGEVTRQLKLLAQELQVTIFCGSQLSRASQHAGVGARRPRLADLRDSGAIEADADVVLGVFAWHLEQPHEWNTNLVEIGVLKQRKGRTRGIAVVKTDGAAFSRASFGDIKEYENNAKIRSAM
jgi:replicative DNA helicase